MPRTQTPPDAPLLTGSAASDARPALRSGARGWGPGTPLAEGDRVSEPVFCLAFCPVWQKQVAMPLASGRLSKWGRHVHWLLVALRGVLPAPRLSSLGCRGLTPSGATVSPDGCGRLQGWNVAGEPRCVNRAPLSPPPGFGGVVPVVPVPRHRLTPRVTAAPWELTLRPSLLGVPGPRVAPRPHPRPSGPAPALSRPPRGSRTPTSSARARPVPPAEMWLVACLLAPLLGLLGPWLDTRASLPVDGASDLTVPRYALWVLLGARAPGGTGSPYRIPMWPSPRLGLAGEPQMPDASAVPQLHSWLTPPQEQARAWGSAAHHPPPIPAVTFHLSGGSGKVAACWKLILSYTE